ncbi:Retrovirus-related Pol polyprotein from transposon 297 [Araneus ventricosus]|uniref:Retrovirus-related Pol polyprotein from transposon 297 n=1 Tax=Araneus ventricosus TaxID=182803 RepID=A0A4Y2W7T3_ARAVE|nr:Retrovirus-related Pol polyprotein from transposon 297 [Araneus ventricosus]
MSYPGSTEVSGKFRYAVTDFPSQVSQKGVLVAATLVDLKRETIPFRVLNLDNKPMTVGKEAVIATCEPVVDIVARPQEFSESLRFPLILENLEGINEEQRTAVKELLQEFQNLLSTSDSDVGRCNMTQHRINTGNHPPIKQYPRRLPLAKKEEAERLVKEMVDNKIIEESSGPWASPILLVKKKYGSTRFCVDYRKLNDITIKNSYHLPRIDDTMDTLNGSQWFSTLDLKSGYWQVEFQPEDKEKTAFTTGQGLWQFKALITSPVLTYPRTDKEFILDTDASNEGIGAVLSQKIGNEECVIAYFSKSLGKPERNYCVTRKELLAIVKSIEHFHHYLYGRKFLLRTDHASFRWPLNFREPEGQIARWIQRLQEYDFEIQHRKGTSHGNADALSRRPFLTTEDPWYSSEFQKAQLEDPDIRPILERKINSEDRPSWQEIAPESPAIKRFWALWDSLHLKDGVLYHQEASTVAEELVRSWISRYGVPMILHSDQGTNFNSALFTELCKLLGILKTRTTALHPESDGMVERFNRTILNHLSLFVSKNQTGWDTHLPLFPLAYRNADHEVTGFTPADMLFGRTLRLPFDIIFGLPSDTPSSSNEYLNNLEARLESVHAFAGERIKLVSERMKTRYDFGATGHHFKERDRVWMYNSKRRRGLSPKLQRNCEGPYTIFKKLNDVIYRVQRSPNAKPKVIHINRLTPYRATDRSSM